MLPMLPLLPGLSLIPKSNSGGSSSAAGGLPPGPGDLLGALFGGGRTKPRQTATPLGLPDPLGLLGQLPGAAEGPPNPLALLFGGGADAPPQTQPGPGFVPGGFQQTPQAGFSPGVGIQPGPAQFNAALPPGALPRTNNSVNGEQFLPNNANTVLANVQRRALANPNVDQAAIARAVNLANLNPATATRIVDGIALNG